MEYADMCKQCIFKDIDIPEAPCKMCWFGYEFIPKSTKNNVTFKQKNNKSVKKNRKIKTPL